MKILFLSRLFYPHVGGVEKHVVEISKILITENHSISLVAEKHKSVLKNTEKYKNISIYRLPQFKENFFKKFKIWFWLWQHQDLIQQADVVHCHDVFFWYMPFRLIYPFKKVYITFHGYETFPISKRAIIIRRISEMFSYGNICVGEFIKKWYNTKPDFVIYGGIHPNHKHKINKSLSAFFYGRLDEHTGIESYVEAYELIKKKYPKFKFTVAGGGKYESMVKKKTQFLGVIEHPESRLPSYRYAFVSRYLSILEALNEKRLVFALYDNPIKKDYLKLTPFSKYIVISKNSKELAENVLYFLKHPKSEEKIIENGHTWIKSQTWEKVVDTYLKLWQNKS